MPKKTTDSGVQQGATLQDQVTEYDGGDGDFPDTRSYGERLLRLFVQVLSVKQPQPLGYFAERLELPEPTVHRMMKEIEKAGYIVRHRLVGERYQPIHEDDEQPAAVFYKLSGVAETSLPPKPVPPDADLDVLRMSAAFSEHLVGKELTGRAETALNFMDHLTKQGVGFSGQPFSALKPGTIDYSGHKDNIIQLIEAIKQQKVCKVNYKSPWRDKPTTFHIQPLKIFCHKDALYLYARKVMGPGERPYVEPEFQPLLAIHRIEGIEKTTKRFPYDSDEFNWERLYNTSFGVIKGEKEIRVVAEFTDWAAVYVAERKWSEDQQLRRTDPDKVVVEFTSFSEPEIISWILQFGEHGRLLKPTNLVKGLTRITAEMKAIYDSETI